jgi:pimeloyl-ACP methyl ester carboxylesterase
MPKVPVRGFKTNYIATENFDKSRPTVLMIHGAGQSSLTWEYQVDALKNRPEVNLIIPDLPGHGKSEGSGYKSIREYSEFIKDFVGTLSLERLILAGHSMGGGIAQVLTLNYPQMVCACILIGTGAKLRVAKETLETVKSDYETFCEVAPSRSFTLFSPEELKRKFVEGLLKTPQPISYWDLVACDEFDSMNDVDGIRVPTLIISATEDILAPVKYGEYLNLKIRNSKLQVIKDAGHFMMQEKPDEFNRILIQFLNSIL